MFKVIRYGLAGSIGVSILAFTPGLAASPHPHRAPVAAVQIVAAPPPAPAADPIVAAHLSADGDGEALVTPETLQKLVDLRAAHPRPLRPAVVCLAKTVYREAADQELKGQLAVAQVVINRTKSARFPRSVCGVVGQPGQFAETSAVRPQPGSRSWATAVAISSIAVDGRIGQVAPGAMFFHADYVHPAWSRHHQRVAQIGDHIFYR